MFFGVGIGAPRSYDVANPAKRAARPDPEAWGNDQPENAGKYTAVVKLAYSRDNKTQNTREKWIAHGIKNLRGQLIRQCVRVCSEGAEFLLVAVFEVGADALRSEGRSHSHRGFSLVSKRSPEPEEPFQRFPVRPLELLKRKPLKRLYVS